MGRTDCRQSQEMRKVVHHGALALSTFGNSTSEANSDCIPMSAATKVIMQVDPDGRSLLAGKPVFTGTDTELWEALIQLRAATGAQLVITPNVSQALALELKPSLRLAYETAGLRLLDGMPLVLLARILGARVAQRHTGADLLTKAAGRSVEVGWRIAIAGGAAEVSSRAANNLRRLYPGADVVSVVFPQLAEVSDSQSTAVIEELHELRPDIVFLCLGSPKQEEWFVQWRSLLPTALYVGAGAAVDFAAGHARRAPLWFQKACLEWLWRLGQEPSRLAGRYLIRGPAFAKIVARSMLKKAATGVGKLRS
jgi:N-acetylglucosaminyldiphosphoundecaprenol N-acetyl-beta-D-mannosaminyltransferase